MQETTFRDAIQADVPALVGLVTSAYRGEASRVGWTTEADVLDGNRIDAEVLRHDIERKRSRVILLERDGTLYCHGSPESDVVSFLPEPSPDEDGLLAGVM